MYLKYLNSKSAYVMFVYFSGGQIFVRFFSISEEKEDMPSPGPSPGPLACKANVLTTLPPMLLMKYLKIRK